MATWNNVRHFKLGSSGYPFAGAMYRCSGGSTSYYADDQQSFMGGVP